MILSILFACQALTQTSKTYAFIGLLERGEIIDLRTVRPMDHDTILESVKKTNRLVILEEAWPFGNVATEITYQVQSQAFDFLDAPIVKLNTADTPAPYSPVLLEEWLPNKDDVVKAVRKVLYKD